MFSVIHEYPGSFGYLYVGLIFTHIFSFTTLLDGKKHGVVAEMLKVAIAGYVLYSQDFSWYGLSGHYISLIYIYFMCSLIVTSKKTFN